jgi:hypothetical protein
MSVLVVFLTALSFPLSAFGFSGSMFCVTYFSLFGSNIYVYFAPCLMFIDALCLLSLWACSLCCFYGSNLHPLLTVLSLLPFVYFQNFIPFVFQLADFKFLYSRSVRSNLAFFFMLETLFLFCRFFSFWFILLLSEFFISLLLVFSIGTLIHASLIFFMY